MSTDLVIFGMGETAILAHEYFSHDTSYEVKAFVVDAAYKESETFCNLPVFVFDEIEKHFPPETTHMFVATGAGQLNRVRATMFLRAKSKGYYCPSYVSSKAFVWHNVKIGENCFILENNVLQAFTEIGDNVVMWSGNHLGHRSVVRDHCFITSHAVISGFCEIGAFSFIGVNACFSDNIKVAKDCFIGMGSVVHKSTEEDGVYVGNPAERRSVPAKKFCKVRSED